MGVLEFLADLGALHLFQTHVFIYTTEIVFVRPAKFDESRLLKPNVWWALLSLAIISDQERLGITLVCLLLFVKRFLPSYWHAVSNSLSLVLPQNLDVEGSRKGLTSDA